MPLPTQAFGRTGHSSTRVIFGAAALGRGTPDDAQEALRLLLDYGVNHIDTAASYGRSERLLGGWLPQYRERFFVATKTAGRTYDAAKADISHSLERLQTPYVDLLQLHNLVDEVEWETALGAGGALEAAVEAREAGLVRHIGVTGHGVTVAAMHLRSLERFPFDSVLLPYNFTMMQNHGYARAFEELAVVCAEREVALQTIKGITLGPWNEKEHTHPTWYEPLSEPAEIATAVHWVLSHPGTFLNSAGDLSLLPHVIEAASHPQPRPPREEMTELVQRRGMAPLFV